MSDELPPIESGGYPMPHSFAWKLTFCEEWQILGSIPMSQADLGKYASLLYDAHKLEDPRDVARADGRTRKT